MSTVTCWAKQKGHYDDLGYTSHFCWNAFHLFRFLYFWTLLKHFFKSATEILSRFQIYQIISFSFSPKLSVLLQSSRLFSKLTNKGCHPERFLFWSGLYWMQFTGSLVFLLGFIPTCWWSFQRKESWDINFLRSCSMSENVFFTLILWSLAIQLT